MEAHFIDFEITTKNISEVKDSIFLYVQEGLPKRTVEEVGGDFLPSIDPDSIEEYHRIRMFYDQELVGNYYIRPKQAREILPVLKEVKARYERRLKGERDEAQKEASKSQGRFERYKEFYLEQKQTIADLEGKISRLQRFSFPPLRKLIESLQRIANLLVNKLSRW